MNFTRKWVVRISIGVVLVAGVAIVEHVREKAHHLAIFRGCWNNMREIGTAGYVWAEDHGGHFPGNFVCLSNELMSTKYLACPADPKRASAANWSQITAENISYELLAPGLPITNTSTVVIRCMIHGTVGYADGRIEGFNNH